MGARPVTGMWKRLLISLALFASALAPAATAQTGTVKKGPGPGPTGTTLSVRVGWGGVVHPDRWNPVYVTLSDATPRNVFFEFRAPHGGYYGMRSHQVITIGPQPQTFIVYMPLRNFNDEDLVFSVREASGRMRRLATYPVGAYTAFAGGEQINAGYTFLGISGRRATLSPVTSALPGALIKAAHVEPEELPESPVGYDCLDVLLLNSPDLTNLTDDQQQSIVKWLRAGGNLILWPGEASVPESSTLVDVLPCRIGTTLLIELSPEELRQAGLSNRFKSLPARELTPAADAQPITLLRSEQITAYQRRVGLGRVIVSPIDLVSIQFSRPDQTWAGWKPVLKPVIRRLSDNPTATPGRAQPGYYSPGYSETAMRQSTAVRQVGDLLGNVPGAGRFGFGYVVGVLIGMMVVVGPLDWLVLKKLGRQPWTWATTAGWIALVTLTAVYMGHVFKSGELHWRTFEVVDQADGATVARTDLAGLYSPRTTEYDIETPAESWWQPASPGDEYYGYRRSGQEVVFAQTHRGSRPDPMVVNVWNLRFLKGESNQAGPALLTADLKVYAVTTNGKSERRVAGTITNTADKAMTNIAIRTRSGVARPFTKDANGSAALRIAPGETATIDALIDETPAPEPSDDPNDWRTRYPYYGANVAAIDPRRLWDQGGDLSMRRTDRIEQWIAERDDLACVYAELESPDPAATLKGQQPIQQHWKVVRALLPMGKN